MDNNELNNETPNDPLNQPEQANPEKPKTQLSPVKLVMIVLGVLVIGGLLVAGLPSSDKKDQVSQDVIPEVVEAGQVSITDEGFDPATITIKVGQAVNWTNNGEKEHQIASDPHPTDDALPELNDELLASGESFSYVFDEAGTFTYHDEFNPLGLKGTVIVE